jgi:hypothetical protein
MIPFARTLTEEHSFSDVHLTADLLAAVVRILFLKGGAGEDDHG